MPAFNLGAFASGIEQGRQTGADLRQKAMQLKMWQQQLDVEKQKVAQQALAEQMAGKASLFQSDMQGIGPAGPTPGVPPAPAFQQGGQGAPPAAPQGAMPMPGATPMPPQAGGPPAPPPGPGGVAPMQPPPGGVMPAGGGAPNAGGAPPAGPPAAGGAPTPQGPPINQNMSGTANGIPDPAKSSQQTLMFMLKNAKFANPNATPAELTRAVNYQLQQMKGLSPEESAYTRAYMGVIDAQLRLKGVQDQVTGRTTDVGMQQAGAAERTGMQQSGATGRVVLQQAGATDRQNAKDATQITTTGMRDDTMRSVGAGHDQARVASSANGGADGPSMVALANKIGRNPIGKAYLGVKAAKDQIDALADDPATATNPSAQLDLIDASVRMASGGVARKAQFDKVAQAAGFDDFVQMHSYLEKGRGVIGPDVIANIKRSADVMAFSASEAARKMFPREVAQLEGESPPSASAGGGGSGMGTKENPARPKTPEEAKRLPPGSYFYDPAGNVYGPTK